MATSGSFNTSGYSDAGWPDHYTFSWTLSNQSIEGNYSVISWSLKGAGGANGYRYTTVKQKYVTVNGATQSNETLQDTYNGTTPFSGTATIYHKSDGTGSFSASAGGAFYYYGSYNSTGSGTWSLPTIPRASAFGTISGNTIGSSMTVNITRNSSSFTHQLWYKLGNSSWYDLGTGIGTSKTFTVTNDLLSQLPSETSGTLQLCIRTYNGSTQIGSDVYKNVTVYVSNSVVPTVGTITLNPVDINNQNILVQGKNQLTISMSGCSAGAGSSIKSYTFSGPGISSTTTSTSVTSGIISDTGILTYTVTVTDNRGRTASKTATIACYAHSAPSITLNAYRVASSTSTTENDSGTYTRCTYNLSYASVNNTNDVTVKIYYKKNTENTWSSVTAFEDNKTTSGSYTLSSIAIDSTYTVYAAISDNYSGNSESNKVTVFAAQRILNVRPKGAGIAFGKMADTDNILDSKWPIRSDDPINSMQYLSYRGTNLISSTTNDTVANWNNQGNLATTLYTKTGQVNGQPSQYGFLLNFSSGVGSTEMHNLWFQQPNGDVSHRGGNGEGLGEWRKFLDSSNYTSYTSPKPTVLFTSGTGTVGTITLSQSINHFAYIEIFYCDNNYKQRNSVKFAVGDQHYITLSCIEPSTNGTEPRLYIRTSGWTIVGTTMTPGRSDLSGQNRGVYAQLYPNANGTNVDAKVESQNYIKIYKILGCK